MPDTTTTDPVAAELAAIRERARQITDEHDEGDCDLAGETCTGHDAMRLLAGYEALLKLHEPMTLYKVAVSGADRDERVQCGHDRETVLEGGGGHELATDGSDDVLCLDQPEATVCDVCWDEDGERAEWPCPTYAAISAALTEEGS